MEDHTGFLSLGGRVGGCVVRLDEAQLLDPEVEYGGGSMLAKPPDGVRGPDNGGGGGIVGIRDSSSKPSLSRGRVSKSVRYRTWLASLEANPFAFRLDFRRILLPTTATTSSANTPRTLAIAIIAAAPSSPMFSNPEIPVLFPIDGANVGVTGDVVGSGVGAAVCPVGLNVESVGSLVGSTVVGVPVWLVGSFVGASVEGAVVAPVGSDVGSLVGCLVVGARVCPVGPMVGSKVGSFVGAKVDGALVSPVG